MKASNDIVTRHSESLIQVRVPVPLALKTINSYLMVEDDGYTWIDPGMNTKQIQDFWQHIFNELGISPKQIKSIICTHQHPDHFGLAGYAQRLTGAPVYLSKPAFAYANLLWGKEEGFSQSLSTLFHHHGMPQASILDIVENLNWFKTLVYPFPQITELLPNTSIQINDDLWHVIETRGHAKGQMMLYNDKTAQLICGDQVLPHITPHVGVVPSEEHELPLEQFLTSLEHIKSLSVNECYPGHGERFNNWASRIDEIIAHHNRRLNRLEELIKERGKLNAYEATQIIFGSHLHKQPQHLRFAITEMIAHLDYLVAQERASCIVDHNRIIFI